MGAIDRGNMPTTVDIEREFRITLPTKHRAALDDLDDRIHVSTLMLKPEGLKLEDIFYVNADLRNSWQGWNERWLAFATNECGDYFAYDLASIPYRVVYIDPIETVEESVSRCEAEGFVFPTFDAWYEYELATKPET